MKAIATIVSVTLLAVLIAGCNPSSGDKEKIYDITGKIVSLAPEKKTVRLDHEDIPGFMKAMEMDFTVQDAKLLTGLKAGDAIHGKLKVKDSSYVITELHKR